MKGFEYGTDGCVTAGEEAALFQSTLCTLVADGAVDSGVHHTVVPVGATTSPLAISDWPELRNGMLLSTLPPKICGRAVAVAINKAEVKKFIVDGIFLVCLWY